MTLIKKEKETGAAHKHKHASVRTSAAASFSSGSWGLCCCVCGLRGLQIMKCAHAVECVCAPQGWRGPGGDDVLLEAGEDRRTAASSGEYVISSSRRKGWMLEIWKSIGKEGCGGARRGAVQCHQKSVYIFSSITHQESHQEFCHAARGKNSPSWKKKNGDKVKYEKEEMMLLTLSPPQVLNLAAKRRE